MRELIEKYAWANGIDLWSTVAVVSGLTEHELVSVYGGEVPEPVLLPFGSAWVPDEGIGRHSYVQVVTDGAHVIALEPNGWTGGLLQIARRASRNGHFASLYDSITGVTQYTEADHGEVSACFDPFDIVEPAAPGDVIPPWAEEAAFDIERCNATCLAVLEHRTGVEIRAEWLTTPLRTYYLPAARLSRG